MLLSALFVIISLSGVLWASQGSGSLYWDGDLYKIFTGPDNLQGLTYNEAQLEFFYSTDFPNDYVEGEWKTFYNLAIGYYVVIICYTIELLFCIVWIIAVSLLHKSVWMVAVVTLLTVLITGIHTGGFVAWWILCKAVFKDDCRDYEVNDGDQAYVCVQAGPVLSLISLCILWSLMICWGFLGTKYILQRSRNRTDYTNLNTIPLTIQ